MAEKYIFVLGVSLSFHEVYCNWLNDWSSLFILSCLPLGWELFIRLKEEKKIEKYKTFYPFCSSRSQQIFTDYPIKHKKMTHIHLNLQTADDSYIW